MERNRYGTMLMYFVDDTAYLPMELVLKWALVVCLKADGQRAFEGLSILA